VGTTEERALRKLVNADAGGRAFGSADALSASILTSDAVDAPIVGAAALFIRGGGAVWGHIFCHPQFVRECTGGEVPPPRFFRDGPGGHAPPPPPQFVRERPGGQDPPPSVRSRLHCGSRPLHVCKTSALSLSLSLSLKHTPTHPHPPTHTHTHTSKGERAKPKCQSPLCRFG
jgi:hypothetical protein